MKILAMISGIYGERIVHHIQGNIPNDWQVISINTPTDLPIIVDEPELFLPGNLPKVDLVLFLAENSRAAQLLTKLVQVTGAKAVIAPVDDTLWIPPGLCRQLEREMHLSQAEIIFPKPFCSMTEKGLGTVAKEFARRFGRPTLKAIIDRKTQTITEVQVERGAPCGSTHYAAMRTVGLKVEEAVPQAGLICLHYPCLASMQPEQSDGGVETLMHTSGKIYNESLSEALKESIDGQH
ncbi:MAG: DUF166 domain-containing protein [Chloroflexota bacterium]